MMNCSCQIFMLFHLNHRTKVSNERLRLLLTFSSFIGRHNIIKETEEKHCADLHLQETRIPAFLPELPTKPAPVRKDKQLQEARQFLDVWLYLCTLANAPKQIHLQIYFALALKLFFSWLPRHISNAPFPKTRNTNVELHSQLNSHNHGIFTWLQTHKSH